MIIAVITNDAVFCAGLGRGDEPFVCYELLVTVPHSVHAHFPLHYERHGEPYF